MTSRKFKFITVTIVCSIAITLAAGSRSLCACAKIYPGYYLGVDLPREIDETVIKKVEIAANNKFAGKSIVDIANTAELCRQEMLSYMTNKHGDSQRGHQPEDPKMATLREFVCLTPLQALAGKPANQLNFEKLTYQIATSGNLLWEDQIAVTLVLDKQIVQQVKAEHERRLFHIPRNFLASLAN